MITLARVATLAAASGALGCLLLAAGGRPRAARWSITGAASCAWAALVALEVLLVSQDYSVRAVAGYARSGAGGLYRIAGAWASPEGSLLVFVTLLASAVAWRARRDTRAAALGAIPTLGFLAISALLADPFERLAATPGDGRGMSPILETPSMLIHPPALYTGLVLAIVAGLSSGPPTVGAADPSADPAASDPSRRGVAAAWTVLLAAMTLGARWSYTEVGWGGFWAWDPVENAGLVPWLLLGAALHLRGGPRGRRALLGTTAVASTLGIALSRSGSMATVHSFAESTQVGWATVAVAAALALALVAFRAPCPDGSPHSPGAGVAQRISVVAPMALALVVAVGTARPLVGRLLGADDVTVEPRFFAWFAAPLAAVLLIGIAARAMVADVRGEMRDTIGRTLVVVVPGLLVSAVAAIVRDWTAIPAAGMGLTTMALVATVVLAARRSISGPDAIAHAGAAVLLGGIAATTLGLTGAATLRLDDSARIAGVTVANRGVRVDGSVITATLDVEGRRVGPRLVGFPSRQVVVPEPALRSTLEGDVQVSLRRADDDQRVLVEVTTKPLVWMVWLGTPMMAIGGLSAAVSARTRRRVDRRRLDDVSPPAAR